MYKVLVTESLAEDGLARLRESTHVDVREGLSHEELLAIVGRYDALIVRSRTRVTADVLRAGERLQVVARAGSGVDNVDVEAATRQGVIVVNAPNGNTIAVAEHTMGFMLALARHIPAADAAMKAGHWRKGELSGLELRGKTLGIIGLGRIGAALSRRAAAFEMRLLAYDPFVAAEYAARQGVAMVPLDELLRVADFVTVHVPGNDHTWGMIGADKLALMKPTAFLINCARGGIVDEEALAAALAEGRLAGAALDVFAQEPPGPTPLVTSPKVICTPHLGAATGEAQRICALDVVEQVLAVLSGRPPRYPVNMPPLSSEEMAALGPYLDLATRLGSFYGQMTGNGLERLELVYAGDVARRDTLLLRAAALAGFLRLIEETPVNLVNAAAVAASRGISVAERTEPEIESFTNLLTIRAFTRSGEHSITGSIVRAHPRAVCINGYWLDFPLEGYLLLSEHIEQPGVLGRMGTILGEAGVNVSFVQVGRWGRGSRGVMVMGLDDPVPPGLLERIRELPSIRSVRLIRV
jgi:D-3-phosphoglycerate dehydrogenase